MVENAGEYALAAAHYGQAAVVARGAGDAPGAGHALNGLCSVSAKQGEYADALRACQQALDLWPQVGDAAGAGGAHAALGALYLRTGQRDRALEQLQQALAFARAAGEPHLEATVLESLGAVRREQGAPAEAVALYDQAHALWESLRDEGGEARASLGLGIAYLELGQPQEALRHLTENAAFVNPSGAVLGRVINVPGGEPIVFERTGFIADVDWATTALLLTYAGDAAALLAAAPSAPPGTSVTGRPLPPQVRVPARAPSAAPAPAAPTRNASATGLLRGRPAATFYAAALTIWRDLGHRQGEGLTLERMARRAEAAGDLAGALDLYQQAIAAREDVRASAQVDDLKTSLAGEAADVYSRATRLLLRLGRPAEAFNLAERGRARTLLDQLGNARLDLGGAADPALLARERALRAEISAADRQLRQERAAPPDAQDGARIGGLGAELAAVQRAYEDVITQLRLADPETSSLVSVAPLTLGEVQGLLDPDTTLVSFFVTPDQTVAFVVRRGDFRAVDLGVGEADLRAAVSQFRAFADPRDVRPPSLARLAGWLVAPLRAQLTTPQVAIVAHGPLHYLPFAALPDGDGYLGDSRALSYLPSASALPFIQQKRNGGADRLLALAQSQVEGLPLLRFANVEAESIARLYDGEALVGAAASKTAFLAQAPEYQILHLAAHGELNEGSPLFSRIFLGADAESDGSLTVQEVYGLDLRNAALAVLSACETQLGAQSRGDDVVGLTRAFIYAGAPSVIASLWSVNDQATAVLMASFYRHLRDGASKAAALQRAQAETRAQYPHPYYWAAFALTSDPG